VGSDNEAFGILGITSGFNPRSRVGSDVCGCGRHGASSRFQSTLPRGERLLVWSCCSVASAVSIHAPAWGATTRAAKDRDFKPVSIHAPAWGATDVIARLYYAAGVSIHAPAWGATVHRPLSRRC